MEISRELLFFFSGLGAFNGMLMGLYFLFVAKPKQLSNYFLGALFICYSIRIGKSVFFYFNSDLAFSYLQFGLTACFFIGPFLYLYISSLFDSPEKIDRKWKWHLAVLTPIALVFGFLYPFEHHVDLWRPYVIKFIYLSWLAYSVLALIKARPILSKTTDSSTKLDGLDFWVLSLLVGNMVIWAAYYFVGITSYILGALLFSFMLYLLVVLVLFGKKHQTNPNTHSPKYRNKRIDDKVASLLYHNLKKVMEEEKLYRDANLKLPALAKRMNVLPHTISQLLNDNIGKGFPQWVNEYRISEAKSRLQSDDNLTLEAIGYECGFNSKSTFFASFKKIVGMTPSRFRDSLVQSALN